MNNFDMIVISEKKENILPRKLWQVISIKHTFEKGIQTKTSKFTRHNFRFIIRRSFVIILDKVQSGYPLSYL